MNRLTRLPRFYSPPPAALNQGEAMITNTPNGTRAAIYARVSTTDQTCENQLLELHRYAAARGWTGADYVDQGISGAKDRRPALDTHF